jgi:hypothetical protein
LFLTAIFFPQQLPQCSDIYLLHLFEFAWFHCERLVMVSLYSINHLASKQEIYIRFPCCVNLRTNDQSRCSDTVRRRYKDIEHCLLYVICNQENNASGEPHQFVCLSSPNVTLWIKRSSTVTHRS